MKQQLEAALDALLELRSRMTQIAPDDAEVRANLRSAVCRLDDLVHRSRVPDRGYENTIRWLSMFLDVEHGAILKTLADSPDSESASSLDRYVRARSGELAQAELVYPATMSAMRHCCGMLGATVGVGEANDGDRLPRELSRLLKAHLEDDRDLRGDLNGLISAMQDLLTEVTRTIQGLGEESTELERAAGLLQQDVPDDPRAVHSLLRNAREGILAAGRRIGESGGRLRRAVKEQAESVKTLKVRLSKAEKLAAHDPLTGLANRRELDNFISSIQGDEAALLMIDIDHFKRINDQHGHAVGDEILTGLTEILTRNIRATDMVARIGGEEFVIVLPGLSRSQAHHAGEALRRSVHMTGFKCQVGKLSVTISIGAATRLANESARDWIRRADQALYNAKNAGRNCIWYADYF